MNLIQLIACIGLITGCFVLLHISPMDFTEGVFRRITSKPKSIRSEVNESTRRKKKSFLRREIEETQTILRMTGRAAKFPMVCALSLLLFLVGAAFALTLGNLFLVPVLAVGMMFVPFWFIRLTANHYKKNIAAELETALSIITTAYLRNEDIQTAVEENIDYLNPPVRSVFVEFLTRIKLVDPDVDAALQDMGTKIDNAVFREWVAALLTCRHDRGLKTILTPIVATVTNRMDRAWGKQGPPCCGSRRKKGWRFGCRKRRSVNFIDFPQLLKPLFIGNDEWISLRKCGIVLLHGQPTGA